MSFVKCCEEYHEPVTIGKHYIPLIHWYWCTYIPSLQVEVTQWVSSKHNMGFAFNHSIWQQIKACNEKFCNHDDYNWDWSLLHVSNTCLTQKLHTLVLRAPRVFHIGER